MASLKALRGRITSVKSTQKITSAMKMVAASKLRRAQQAAEAARPYAELMQRMLAALADNVAGSPSAPRILVGTGQDKVHLLVVISADRGLAGAFNTNVGRAARTLANRLESEGKTVKILTVGRKARDYLRRDLETRLLPETSLAGKKVLAFADALALSQQITALLDAGEFDVCTLVYNHFNSVISQTPGETQLIPAQVPQAAQANAGASNHGAKAVYEFEPDEETLLAKLLPQNLAIQIYRAILESAAGEHAARMTAMDNATRNAGDMIKRLSLTYNRTRQANITRELIEIISGAEAL
ncbi:ATP synthase gamma chain [Granulibacter bethesdensis]|uniref:ATP synthase gamma chain n=1 Tax=Granulibacter bethesdensis TaxID=364410 RepID=A0AAC9K8M8_9PROT|nr:F0F1 ATP synthase subunit gamma [Granulibacter bethesdensis]APH55375.1 ATP synthase gamma chain [Granulibacter bethesdensis]APH62961.1 ATP synthase gamma chain [Granulibacter bethesdensis]